MVEEQSVHQNANGSAKNRIRDAEPKGNRGGGYPGPHISRPLRVYALTLRLSFQVVLRLELASLLACTYTKVHGNGD